MLPPGPRLPSFLQMAQWATRPIEFLTATQRKYGDTFTLRLLGFGESVFLSHPDDVAAVFASDGDTLRAGEGNDILLPFLGVDSVLVQDGPKHRRARKLMMHPFHGQRMRLYGATMLKVSRDAVSNWTPGSTVRVLDASQRLSLDVILRVVFGFDGAGFDRARTVIVDAMEAITPAVVFFPLLQRDLGPLSPGRRLQQRGAVQDALLDEVIRDRRATPGGHDVLSMLLEARDEAGEPMSDTEVRSQLLTLLTAGHETTATALAWAMHHLARDPEARARVAEEIQGVEDPAALAKLPFLGAVCNEALRLVPVLPIVMRVVRGSWSLRDQVLPLGSRVAPCITLVHRRPDLYPDPEAFVPERFLDRRFGPSEFFPFGGGGRRCIGAAFAEYEMRIALAEMVRKAGDFRPVDASVGYARRHITMAPADGARIAIA